MSRSPETAGGRWLRRTARLLGRLTGSPGDPAPARHPAPAALLQKVRRIEIVTDRLVDEGLAGGYSSAFRGRGVAFAEARPYQPGDDVRTVDWNVTARMGHLYVKRYVEERDLTVFLLIDVSGSLAFGSQAVLKRELAAEVATLLAASALRNGDRVGAALAGDGVELHLPPSRRRTQLLRLTREILHAGASETRSPSDRASADLPGADLGAALQGVLASLRQRAVLFIVSDFLDQLPERAFEAAAARHDTVAIEVLDPRDDELPAVGPLPLADAESGELAVVDGRRLRDAHSDARAEQRRRLQRLTGRLGIDLLELSTDRPYLPALRRFFELRKKRRRAVGRQRRPG